jgi:hypothetical protein
VEGYVITPNRENKINVTFLTLSSDEYTFDIPDATPMSKVVGIIASEMGLFPQTLELLPLVHEEGETGDLHAERETGDVYTINSSETLSDTPASFVVQVLDLRAVMIFTHPPEALQYLDDPDGHDDIFNEFALHPVTMTATLQDFFERAEEIFLHYLFRQFTPLQEGQVILGETVMHHINFTVDSLTVEACGAVYTYPLSLTQEMALFEESNRSGEPCWFDVIPCEITDNVHVILKSEGVIDIISCLQHTIQRVELCGVVYFRSSGDFVGVLNPVNSDDTVWRLESGRICKKRNEYRTWIWMWRRAV